jgi:hypothetical protein
MAVTDAPDPQTDSQDSLAAEYVKQNPSANPSTAATTALNQPTASAAPESQDDLAAAYAKQSAPQEGEQKNDVGNTVIVPKDGESFADTMKRAAAQGKKTTPEMVNKEIATMPEKAAQVIAAAPIAGAAGAAGLESPAILPAVLPHTIEGIKAISAWATAHPVQAYMLYNVVKELIPSAKKAMGLVKNIPTE